jgi:hypothetical protein
MPTRRHLLAALLALLALPLLFAGCKIETINYFPPKPANVRFLNLIPDAPALNVAAGGNVVWSGVAFEGTTAYVDFDNTVTQDFTVSVAGSTSSLVSISYQFAGEQPFTMVAYGPVEAPQVITLADAGFSPGNGRFQIRAVHLAAGSGGLDIYFTSPGVAIDSVAATYYNITYGSATAYAGFTTGAYQVRATLAGTTTVVYDSGPLAYNDSVNDDFIFYTRGSGQLVNAVQATVNGASGIVNGRQARLKAVNAAVDAGAVNQLLDGTAFVSNLAYAAASSYGNASPASHTIGFEAAATPGAVIASVARTLAAATDTTVFVSGLPGAQTAIALTDSNLPPLSGNVRVRFVNALPGTTAVNVAIDGVTKVTGLAYAASSGYLEFASGKYALTFTDPTSGAVLLALPDVQLDADHTSSVYAIGSGSSLKGLVTQDN